MRIMATVLRASTIFSCAGMAVGPPFGGWICDTTGSYGWLLLGSFGIGLGATLIALFFPDADPGAVKPYLPRALDQVMEQGSSDGCIGGDLWNEAEPSRAD